jgi:hypothetical protein
MIMRMQNNHCVLKYYLNQNIYSGVCTFIWFITLLRSSALLIPRPNVGFEDAIEVLS